MLLPDWSSLDLVTRPVKWGQFGAVGIWQRPAARGAGEQIPTPAPSSRGAPVVVLQCGFSDRFTEREKGRGGAGREFLRLPSGTASSSELVPPGPLCCSQRAPPSAGLLLAGPGGPSLVLTDPPRCSAAQGSLERSAGPSQCHLSEPRLSVVSPHGTHGPMKLLCPSPLLCPLVFRLILEERTP